MCDQQGEHNQCSPLSILFLWRAQTDRHGSLGSRVSRPTKALDYVRVQRGKDGCFFSVLPCCFLLCFCWMVFVFAEAEPSGAAERWNSEGAMVSRQADGSCLCFSSSVPG